MYKDKDYYINQIFKIYHNDKINYTRIIQKNAQLKNFVIQNTPLLNDAIYTFTTRLTWIMAGITNFPICQTCGKQFGFNKNIRLSRIYSNYCSIKCLNKNKIRNEKIRNNCIKKAKQTASKIRETCLAKYGVENVSQVPEIMNKIKKSQKETYSNKEKLKQINEKYLKGFIAAVPLLAAGMSENK